MKSVTFLLLIILGLSTAVDRWPGLKLNDRLFASSSKDLNNSFFFYGIQDLINC